MALSDRILVMRDGIAQQIDTPLNIYTKPANRFIFSFIGLSNFLPVVVKKGAVYIEGVEDSGPVSQEPPSGMDYDHLTLACRPSEIDLLRSGGVRATVKRKVYLGEIIDYRIMVGETEVRVQKGRRSTHFDEGDTCYLKFSRLLWYPRD
jgi:iron(III) transport system ATP-binding protein